MEKIVPFSIRVIVLLIAFYNITTGIVAADVVREEPNEFTVVGSDVIAIGTLEAVQGEQPFTHKHPPDLIFQVTRAIKGCSRGDLLKVLGWIERAQPHYGKYGVPLPESEIKQWQQS